MRSPFQSLIWSLLILSLSASLSLIAGCNAAPPANSPTADSPASNSSLPNSPTVQTSAIPSASSSVPIATASDALKFKQADGTEAFSIKFMSDGAKLVDASDAELARFTRDANQKIKIKDRSDRPLGYVVSQADHWKVENADQTQELFILRRQPDGDYKLEDGANQVIYRIKVRDYGFEIETPDKQSLYKVKVKEGKISLRDANDQTVLSIRADLPPIALACFSFDKLNREQQAALAYGVYLAGEQ